MVSAWREQLSARLAEPFAGGIERNTELASIHHKIGRRVSNIRRVDGKALGLEVPPTVLARADEVIQ